MVRGPVRGHEGGHVAGVLQPGRRPSMVWRSMWATTASIPSTPGGIVSGTPPVRRVTNRLEAAQVVVTRRVARPAEGQDHARPLPDHAAAGGPRGQEGGPHGGVDRPEVVLQGHLHERGPLHVAV